MQPSLLARVASACLLALALAMPLVPQAEDFVSAKHVAYLALAGAGMACLAFDALGRRRAPALGTPVDLWVLAFAAAVLVALPASVNPGVSRYHVGLVLATVLTYVLAVKTLRTPRDVRALFLCVLVAALAIAAFGLLAYQRFRGAGLPEVERSRALAGPFFAHSYLAAQYLVPVFSGALVLVLERGLTRAWRLVASLALLPIGAYLLVIGSRGAYLAIALALGAHLLLRLRATGAPGGRRAQLAALLGRLALVAGAAAAMALLAALLDLLPGGATFAVDRVLLVLDPQASDLNFSRLGVWRDTLRMAADHLVLGVGPGGFDTALPSYHAGARPVPHAHNQFLHVLAEHGLVGLIAFLFLVRHAWLAARRGAWHVAGDDERRALFHASAAALAAASVYFLFETPLKWAEAGSLVMLLLAAMTRAGCHGRERAGRPAAAFAGLVLASGVLGLAGPAWLRYGRAADLLVAALDEQRAARAAAAAGQGETARARAQTAADMLAEADRWFPHHAEFQSLRADLFSSLGRWDDALAAARLADQRAPGNFRHLSSVGIALVRLKRPADALEPLRAAIEASAGPDALEAYVLLARSYYALGRHEEAWFILSGLLEHWWQLQRPDLLLDAARTLLNLDRNLSLARTLLLELQRTGGGADPDYVASLLEETDRMLERPRRPIRR